MFATKLKELFFQLSADALEVRDLQQLVDVRFLSHMVNAFVPKTFTPEILLNDRWSLNLALRTLEKVLRIETSIDSEDLVEVR